MRVRNKLFFIVLSICFGCELWANFSSKNLPDPYTTNMASTVHVVDTIPLVDREGDFITDKKYNPFDITPKEIEQKVEFDPKTGNYIVYEKIGDEYYRTPTYLTFEEYLEYTSKQQEKQYFQTLGGIQSEKKSLSGKINPMDKVDLQTSLVDRLFGGTEVNIQPQGSVDLSIGWLYSRRDDPQLPIRAQRQSQPDFPTPLIKMNVDGKIGKKLDLDFNYDTQSTFDFDRQIKLAFDSDAFSEDDIIKKIEIGNVNFPLRSNLIQGSQSLFGFKTELQFGRLRLTGLYSQQRSRSNNLNVQNGTSTQEFIITPNEYDENRHFFLSHYNRNTYEDNLINLPFIATPHQIAQIEVWVSDDRPEFQDNSTMVVAISDLGEPEAENFTSLPSNSSFNCDAKDDDQRCLPRNEANDIYARILRSKDIADIDKVASQLARLKLTRTQDFELFRGRRLSPSEYTFHPQLGTISLSNRLRPNQVLGVAYNYYYTSNCDTVYQVGQISANSVNPGNQADTSRVESPKVHFVKLLKSTNQITTSKMWDLMMKNVYNLRTSQLNQQDFEFDIFYEDDYTDGTLKKFLNEPGLKNMPLLQLFNLDRLNRFNDPQPDGFFDYIPGVTVIERSGSVVFPVLEPFGEQITLAKIKKALQADSVKVVITEEELTKKYRYQQLYDTTISIAAQELAKSKFRMIGRVKSSVSNGEIPLGAAFVPRGSVRVSAGGNTLVENQDYEIDYDRGVVRIINPSILSQGVPINVSFEDNSLFSLQQKNMLGLRAEYQFNKKSSLGATYLNLTERPTTQKVNIGEDPINNTIIGMDFNHSDESAWIGKMLDKLPFYSTSEKANVNLTAEVAGLIPGHASAINTSFDNTGIANIDDFEGAITNLPLGGFNTNAWSLSSTPVGIPGYDLDNGLAYGANRAKLNWYSIDQGLTSFNGTSIAQSPYTRLVLQNELFTNRQVQPGQQQFFTFDLSYYPSERGPYNFDDLNGITIGGTKISDGFRRENDNIILNSPEKRWGGIMRYFQNSDFEAANYESIEFWMLNPFMDYPEPIVHPIDEEGEIIFNLGNISEDIIKDNFLFFENGLPTSTRRVPTTNTAYGKATVNIPLVNGFDLTEGTIQDVGFDGLNNEEEAKQFQSWLIRNNLSSVSTLVADPSNDDFVFFNDPSLGQVTNVLTRFKSFNGPQGNTPLGNTENNNFVRGNRYPDTEDINNNKSLDQTESFYEYRLKIKKSGDGLDTTALGKYYRQTVIVKPINNGPEEKWYRIQIPIQDPKATKVGQIQGYRAIQFMRMYLTNFKAPKTFRLAEFQLQRSQWRKQPPKCVPDSDVTTGIRVEFSIDDVGVEENSGKLPFNYLTPRGVLRQNAFGTVNNLLQDERSMLMKFGNLPPSCEVSMTKLTTLNLALFKRLQLFVHAENEEGVAKPIKDKKLAIIVRLGKDFDNGLDTLAANRPALNYYEYELPLTFSKDSLPRNAVENVWPEANFVNVPLDSFLHLKRERINNELSVRNVIEQVVNPAKGDKVRMIGNPSLAGVKVIQIAVKNISDEKDLVFGQVWVNEFRVTGFNESGGVAALAKMQVQLADLGELNVSGNYSSIGFGALDKRLLERNREETIQYDLAANIDGGKLLPKALKLTVPIYAQYQKTVITPQFDPFDGDLTVSEKLDLIQDEVKRDSIQEVARRTSTIKTFNLTNIKTNVGGTGKPWSPSNISVSYAFTETTKTDPYVKEDKSTQRSFGLDYIYTRKSTFIEPFKFIKVKALKFISDFNFSLIPSNFTFTSRMIDQNNVRTFRLPSTPIFSFEDKRFNWERNYVLDWDFTKSLRFGFRANTDAIVDQLRYVGIADNLEDRRLVDQKGNDRDENGVLYSELAKTDDPNFYRNKNLRSLGRARTYKHNVSLNYKLPFKSIPYFDWVDGAMDYKADYAWEAGSQIFLKDVQPDGSIEEFALGNTIRNGQNSNFNITFNFGKLYNSIGYLKAIETGKAQRSKKNANDPSKNRKVSKNDNGEDRLINQEKTLDDQAGGDEKNKGKDNKNKKTEKEDAPKDPSMIERVLIRPLMAIRSIKLNIRDDRTTMLPGFMPQSSLLGMSDGFAAPGWDFISGVQPRLTGENNWLQTNQSWFNPSTNFSRELMQTKRQTYEAKLLIEPFKDFSIDVNFKKVYSESFTETFRNKGESNNPKFLQIARYEVGSFEATSININTLFDNSTQLYETFKENRRIISRRLPNVENPGVHLSDPSYTAGYGPTHTSVTIPAFVAAYTNQSPFEVELDQRKTISNPTFIPKPNWQLNYTGLSKFKMFKKIFSNITINHKYNSNFRVNSFQSSPLFNATNPFETLSPNNNYYSRLEIPAVSIQEQFVPLLGISVKTVKDMKINFEYKVTRSLELGITQLRENKATEIVFGGGYVIKNFKPFKNKKKSKRGKKSKGKEKEEPEEKKDGLLSKLSNDKGTAAKARDLRINVNYSLRDDVSQIYDLLSGIDAQADRGTKTITFNPTVEYDVNKNLALSFYFSYSRMVPKTTLQFPVTTIRSGITLRFNIN